jgi:hypothetical protein
MNGYLLIYFAFGAAFASLMALVQGRRRRGAQGGDRGHAPVSVYVMISLAWPVAAAAFAYGLVAHLIGRTAAGDGAS